MNKKRRIVEATPSIHIRDVRSCVLPGAQSVSIRTANYVEGVGVTWRNAHFGGMRAYFECPHCFKAAEILYSAPFLACRSCHSLAYRSENLTRLWRKSAKLKKLQTKAGAATDRFPAPIPPKPKWQRWHTYLNLRRAVADADHDFASSWALKQCRRIC